MIKQYSYLTLSGLRGAGVYYAGLRPALTYDALSGLSAQMMRSPERTIYANDGCSPSDTMNNYSKVLKGRYILTQGEVLWKSAALKEHSPERA